MTSRAKIISVIIILVCGCLIFNNLALAEDSNYLRQGLDTAADQGGLKTDITPTKAVGKIVNVVLTFLGLFFLGIMLFAGITMMTAGGRPEAIKKAKNLMIHASIGLAVALMAWQVASLLIKKTGVEGTPGATVSTQTPEQIAQCKTACGQQYESSSNACSIYSGGQNIAQCQEDASKAKTACENACQ